MGFWTNSYHRVAMGCSQIMAVAKENRKLKVK
jgi:hypothetical protein